MNRLYEYLKQRYWLKSHHLILLLHLSWLYYSLFLRLCSSLTFLWWNYYTMMCYFTSLPDSVQWYHIGHLKSAMIAWGQREYLHSRNWQILKPELWWIFFFLNSQWLNISHHHHFLLIFPGALCAHSWEFCRWWASDSERPN